MVARSSYFHRWFSKAEISFTRERKRNAWGFERVITQAGIHVIPVWESLSTTALVNAVINGLGIAVYPIEWSFRLCDKAWFILSKLKDWASPEIFILFIIKISFWQHQQRDLSHYAKIVKTITPYLVTPDYTNKQMSTVHIDCDSLGPLTICTLLQFSNFNKCKNVANRKTIAIYNRT